MSMSSTQQQALEKVLERASVDLAFRRSLLTDPRRAIFDVPKRTQPVQEAPLSGFV